MTLFCRHKNILDIPYFLKMVVPLFVTRYVLYIVRFLYIVKNKLSIHKNIFIDLNIVRAIFQEMCALQ